VSNTITTERVLQVHTRYLQPGGEDQVVEAERALLERAGIEVRQVIFDNSGLAASRSPVGDLRIAGTAIWSQSAEDRIRAAVTTHQPDVVHVHNTFAAASPSVFRAVGDRPVVQTLHNYRWVCPAAIAFRGGRVCTDCVGRPVALPAVVHACVRASRAQSAVAAASTAVHRAAGTLRRIDQFVALTAFQRRVMIDGGLPADRVRVISNFREPDPGIGDGSRSGVLFLGRLTEEKGIGSLVRASRLMPGILRVAGAGPLESAVAEAGRSGALVQLGRLDTDVALDELRAAVALVVPSIWFEGFPMVVLEAYATGTPVIASRIGSLAEVVEDGVTGLLARPDDAEDLARQIRWAVEHPTEMARFGANARARFEARFRGADHLVALLDLYRDVTQARSGGPGVPRVAAA
jgi:glycosyltransferase involved in cell wall biosynthesis